MSYYLIKLQRKAIDTGRWITFDSFDPTVAHNYSLEERKKDVARYLTRCPIKRVRVLLEIDGAESDITSEFAEGDSTVTCASCSKEHTEEYVLRYSETTFPLCSTECLFAFASTELLVEDDLDPEEFIAMAKKIVAEEESDREVRQDGRIQNFATDLRGATR